jgi:U3 small nucleolar RNA-associated protein 3
MAKKRKASGRPAVEDSLAGWNERGGKLGPINTFEDVADSEDEFHINRDKILFEDGPDAKRRRKWQEEGTSAPIPFENDLLIKQCTDALLEHSDEEVLGYSSESEEDDETNEADAVESSDGEGPEGEDEDMGGWGTSKKDYYDNDNIETEADALEEEQEARRLQQKRLQKMTEADFGLDEFDWVTGHEGTNEGEGNVVTEVLKDIEITPDMGPKERLNILQTRYPEFGSLANELVDLHPLLENLKQQVLTESGTYSTQSTVSSTVVKARALAAYVGSLAMYFAILSSPAKNSQSMPLDPTELRDHAVMDSLLRCRQLWTEVKSLNTPAPAQPEVSVKHKAMEVELEHTTSSEQSTKNNQLKSSGPNRKTQKQLAIEAVSVSLADLSALVPKRAKKTVKPVTIRSDDESSDFGEETSLTAKDAAAKASRHKNLSFYTSQIAQKANKRGEKGREAGGDMDLPHKERFRDRQARLNAEAEARGKQLDAYGRGGKGVALEQEGDSENDKAVAKELRGDEDEYYDMISKSSKDRKRTNEEHRSAIRQAKEQNSLLRVVEGEIDEDGKRAIGYVIEKNRGLAPKRKKDVRNPRVKKRKKFEEKKKKLSSVRAVYKGGEERGGYGGEKTGIKTNLVKSVKL